MGLATCHWLLVACLLSALRLAAGAWCGKEGCYQVLGLKESADAKEIKTVYYKMSRQYHPDKNKDAGAPAKFQRYAKAYEILSDPRSRKRYDYALAHPEEDIQEEVYGIWKYWRTDVRAVLAGAVLVFSAIQFFAKKAHYESTWRKIRETPRYKNRRLQVLEDEARRKASSNGSSGGGSAASVTAQRRAAKARTKAPANGSKEPLDAEEEKRIQDLVDGEVGIYGEGLSEPSYKDTIAYQMFIAPVRAAKWVHWKAHWQWAYNVLKQDYKPEDKAYLTRKQLGYSVPVWEGIDPDLKEELLAMELWVPDNYRSFTRDNRPGSMKKRLPRLTTLEREAPDDPWAAVTGD